MISTLEPLTHRIYIPTCKRYNQGSHASMSHDIIGVIVSFS